MEQKKVSFYTLGCKLNYSESSTLGRSFEEAGFKRVEFYEKSDVVIVNTCSVTDTADKKCRKVIKEALKYSPGAFIGVTGCYAQLKPNEIASIPGVDAVIGTEDKFNLTFLLKDFRKKESPTIFHSDLNETLLFQSSYSQNQNFGCDDPEKINYQDRTRAFLKIQDGCDYTCSFCTIPLARGKSRSDSIENIVLQVEKILHSGTKEIVLTGVNTGDFITEKKENFFALLKVLDNFQEDYRIRVSSIEPNLLTDDIIRFISESKHFVPHFHIPLQSGSDKILRLMKRRYLCELYADRVSTIRRYMPDCCIGSDVMVGFPGELETDFQQTYNFIQALEISYLHVFTYSERGNTVATLLPGKVSPKLKQHRSLLLHELSELKRKNFYQSQKGKTLKVLFEIEQEKGIIHGFTENYVRVKAEYDPLLVNEFVSVNLDKMGEDGVYIF